ncbi:hypothetical protein [Bacillus sp. UMB0728]|uniref:hypothetical protein n=1 Tax=Bacillus sp. UMB0728 TaxID=2066052 RepID=UPI000C77EEB9|nr:hypothetical protein [Bacillus sp. UMB0728]PLR73507.1 hypothetical protein CYJ37_08170 [Bacillus sp. UMB0728]
MKKKAIKLATSTAIAATAFVAAAPANQADAAVNVEALVKDAENAAGALKWAISVEGTADGANAPWALYNLTKDATASAKAAVAKTSGKDKVLYEARLQAADVQISRAMAYIDGITAGKKIEAGTAALKSAIASKDLDKVEANYHALTKEVRKQAELLYRVYGQSTRALILDQTKKPAEDAVKSVQVDVTVHMHLADAAAAVKAGDYKKAGEHVEKANAWFDKVSAAFKDELTKDRNDVVASLPLTPVSVVSNNENTVTVQFNKAVDVVSVAHFAFDNGLTVSDAKLSADKKTVTLTTTKQADGKTYTLSYKGAATVSFTTPTAPVDSSLVIDNSAEAYLKNTQTRSFTATFKNADGTPYRGFVDIAKAAGDTIDITTVNGTAVGSGFDFTKVVPNVDGKITITVAPQSGVEVKSGKVTFTNLTTNKKVTTGETHFVPEATQGDNSSAVTINYVNKAGKYFVANNKWYNYDSTDVLYNNGALVDTAAFEGLLAEGNQIKVNYQNVTTAEDGTNTANPSGISYFNVTFVKTLKDLEVTTPNRDTSDIEDAFRVSAKQQFFLRGEGHPNYSVHIYKTDGSYLVTVPVNGSGQWSYQVNLQANGLHKFLVVQTPATQQAPATAPESSEVVHVQEGTFTVAGNIVSTPATTSNVVSVGSELEFTFSSFGSSSNTVVDEATFSPGATLTFEDNQGVRATYTVGSAVTDTKVINNTNSTNNVDVKLGSPVYTWPQGNTNVTFNHTGAIRLVGVTGVTNQDGLKLELTNPINVTTVAPPAPVEDATPEVDVTPEG